MSLLIDVHAHLDGRRFEKDIDLVIERAKKAGICTIIEGSLDVESNRKALELAKKYPIVKAALGFYPIEALKLDDSGIDKELEFIEANKDKIIAISEVGLDYHWDKKEHDRQKEIFLKVIKLAEKVGKPIIVHTRKAEKDTIDMLEGSKVKKVVLHCFSGSFSLVKRAEELGYYFSIPTNVVFSNHFQELVKKVNINHLLCETDCPYLSPFKGKRNEPSFVLESYKKIAEIKGMELKEVVNNVWMNFKSIF